MIVLKAELCPPSLLGVAPKTDSRVRVLPTSLLLHLRPPLFLSTDLLPLLYGSFGIP